MASDLPFNFLYKTIVINMIYFCIVCLNAFPVKNEVSQELYPRSIVLRTKLSWKNHCRIQFGGYSEVHNEPNPINTISPRTHPAISVGSTGNFNGTIKFFCMITGRILKLRNFTRYPMLDRIIKKNAWGKKTKREVYENVIEFKDRCKNPYQWDPEDDMDGLLEGPNPHEIAPIPDDFPGVGFDADLDEEVATPQ